MNKKLKAIVPHAFGDYSGCDVSWCGYLKNSSNYQHSTLSHGKDLQGDKLKEDLTAVVNLFVQNVERLAPIGSSKQNEALNNTIGSKAPKIRHYGSIESNEFRVACAVGQKKTWVLLCTTGVVLHTNWYLWGESNGRDSYVGECRGISYM